MTEENKGIVYKYKCTQCGTIMLQKTEVKPMQCTFCGDFNIVPADQGDRSTRFGKTKPAEIVTKC